MAVVADLNALAPRASRAARPRSTGRPSTVIATRCTAGGGPAGFSPRGSSTASPRAVVNTGARRRSGPRPRRWDNWASIAHCAGRPRRRSWRFQHGLLCSANSRSWRLAIRQMPRVVLSQSDSPSSARPAILSLSSPSFAVNAWNRPSRSALRPRRTSRSTACHRVQVQRADLVARKPVRHGKEPRVSTLNAPKPFAIGPAHRSPSRPSHSATTALTSKGSP